MATPLTEIPGIGPSTAEILQTQGFDSAETLAASTVEKVSEVPGFGSLRASAVIRAANELLNINTTENAESKTAKTKNKASPKKDKKKKPKNKDKKGKGKGKGKTKDKKKKKNKDKKNKKSRKKK